MTVRYSCTIQIHSTGRLIIEIALPMKLMYCFYSKLRLLDRTQAFKQNVECPFLSLRDILTTRNIRTPYLLRWSRFLDFAHTHHLNAACTTNYDAQTLLQLSKLHAISLNCSISEASWESNSISHARE